MDAKFSSVTQPFSRAAGRDQLNNPVVWASCIMKTYLAKSLGMFAVLGRFYVLEPWLVIGGSTKSLDKARSTYNHKFQNSAVNRMTDITCQRPATVLMREIPAWIRALTPLD